MTIFAEDLGFPEGPVLLPDGSFLFVEMSPETGCVTHISGDGKSRHTVAKTGRPNGLALDGNGDIWVAETQQHALLRMSLNGEYEQFAKACKGEKFKFLNDVAIAPNGNIYLTDSGILMDEITPNGELAENYRELSYDGSVFCIDRSTAEVNCVDRGMLFTNGLSFCEEGNLYLNETLTGNIYRYQCSDGIVTGTRELFGNVIEKFDSAVLKGPDGMKFDADGNLYVCVFGQGDVTVLNREGHVINRIKTQGSMPSNLVFGASGEKAIYVTEVETGTVQIFNVGTDGCPLYM